MAEHGHGHGHAHTAGDTGLFRAFLVILVFFVVELAGGLYTNSLALLADAGHMFTDVLALGAAFIATRISERASTETVTFGYYRAEIIVALVNGISLVLIAIYIFYEAYNRLLDPPEVRSGAMMIIAAVGLVANLVALRMLTGSRSSLNVRAAFLHVIGDTLGSVGALVAGAIMLYTGTFLADPAVSFLIGIILIVGSVRVVRDAVDVLLQSVPKQIDVHEVRDAMQDVDGVVETHDVHIWALKEDVNVLSGHVVVDDLDRSDEVLATMCGLLQRDYHVDHSTLQIESPDMVGRWCKCEF